MVLACAWKIGPDKYSGAECGVVGRLNYDP